YRPSLSTNIVDEIVGAIIHLNLSSIPFNSNSFVSITTSLFVYCSQNFSTRSSKTRRKPSPLTKNTGTSFSTNSNVPWKNSAEVTAFVRTHKYSSKTHIDEK